MELGVKMCSVQSILLVVVCLPYVVMSNKEGVSVSCDSDHMVLEVPAAGVAGVKLDKWFAIPGCQFVETHDAFRLQLRLADTPCGITRVTNKLTGVSLYYQQLRVFGTDGAREHVMVKCTMFPAGNATHNVVRRDLPPEFVEPDYIEITSEVTGSAPVPILGVGVRQNGALVDGAIDVAPGTPLSMEVFLDNGSAGTYGILVSYLEVTNNARKKETIVYNGCTIDPNLFENFDTKSGDFLSAKFRAFKFPESNYVLFRGTVDVCLDKCEGITCSDGKVGYGRRRRDVVSTAANPNKLFEVTMTTFIKFSEDFTSEGVLGSSTVMEKEEEIIIAPGGSAAPITRRSPNNPPSVVFSSAVPNTATPFLLALAVVFLLQLLRC
ncbi:Zona pellucida domain [Trinorchestia longiramus]|nr:Zona pellucida domain [Trinorchestia longiramus]